MKKVSILIALYNKEKYIIDTLRSVNGLEGRDRFKLELVVVNDASTDSSEALVRDFKWQTETDLVLISNDENSGPSVSMNRAFAQSTGDYIVPHDADDLITRQGVLKRFLALETNPDYDWVTGNELIMDINGKLVPGSEFVKSYTWSNNKELQELIMGKMLIPAQSLMIKREVLKQQAWNNRLWASQDTWINYILTVKGYKLLKIDDYVACYRSPAGSEDNNSAYVSATKSGRMYKDYLVIKEEIREYLTPEQLAWFEGIISNAKAAAGL